MKLERRCVLSYCLVYGNKLHIIDGIHITGHYTHTHTSLGALVLGRWSITVAVLEAEARVLPAGIVATPDTLDVASTLELTLYTIDEVACPQPQAGTQKLITVRYAVNPELVS